MAAQMRHPGELHEGVVYSGVAIGEGTSQGVCRGQRTTAKRGEERRGAVREGNRRKRRITSALGKQTTQGGRRRPGKRPYMHGTPNNSPTLSLASGRLLSVSHKSFILRPYPRHRNNMSSHRKSTQTYPEW